MKSIALISILFPLFGVAQKNFEFRIRTENHTSRIDAVKITNDGIYTITCSADKSIKVWDTETGDFLWEYAVYQGKGRDGAFTCFDIDPIFNTTIATGGMLNEGDLGDSIGGRIVLFDFKTRQITQELYGHFGAVTVLKFLRDGIHLISADQTGNVILWNLKDGTKKKVRTDDGAEPTISITEFGFIVNTGISHLIYNYIPEFFPEKPLNLIKIPLETKSNIASTTYVLSKKILLIGLFNNKILVFDSLFILKQTVNNQTVPSGFALDKTEKILATGRSFGETYINFYQWSNDTLQLSQSLDGFRDLVKGLAFTKDNLLILGDNETGSLSKLIPENGVYKIKQKLKKLGLTAYSVGVPRGTEQGKIYFSIKDDAYSKGFSRFTHVFDLINRKISPLHEDVSIVTRPITEIGDLSLESGQAEGKSVFSNVLRLTRYGEEKPLMQITSGNVFRCYTLTLDSSMIVAGGRDGVLEAFNRAGKKICNLQGHTGDLFCVNESPDKKFIISSGRDGLIHFWDRKSIATHASVAPAISIYFQSMEDWVIWTSDGYFTSTRSGAKLLGFQQNFDRKTASRFIPIGAFDITYNRPDVVFKRLGVNQPELIALYEKAAEKRLKKAGLTTFPLFEAEALPEINYITQNSATAADSISLLFTAVATKNAMQSIVVLNQGVPVTKVYLKKNEKNYYAGNLKIALSDGKNIIEVVATTEKGLRSIGEKLILQKTTKRIKKLYMIAVSVSDYRDETLQLKYAVKDGRDLRNTLLKTSVSTFDEILTDTLFNTAATKQNILNIKTILSSMSPNDAVILYFSGHGFLDKEQNFYYGTYNIDAQDPAFNGISFKEIENLFEGCSALKRMILLDACHSGEVDKEETEVAILTPTNETEKPKLTVYQPKGAKIVNNPAGTNTLTSFDVLQEIFSELGNENGIEVIAASAGNSYAFESDVWQNGIFTYCILKSLFDTLTDKNNDHHISINEMKKYVAENVFTLTKGKQKPAMRQEINATEWFLK